MWSIFKSECFVILTRVENFVYHWQSHLTGWHRRGWSCGPETSLPPRRPRSLVKPSQETGSTTRPTSKFQQIEKFHSCYWHARPTKVIMQACQCEQNILFRQPFSPLLYWLLTQILHIDYGTIWKWITTHFSLKCTCNYNYIIMSHYNYIAITCI